MEDLKNHFRMGYAPNNCTLVIVGDVTYDQVITLAKKYLEPIPRQEPPPPVRTKEPPQQGERRVTLAKPAQLPMQLILYHVPETKHPDAPVLEVIGTLLTRGQSSRLYRRMVDVEQIALSVGGGAGNALDPTLFRFSIQPRSGIDPAVTEKALFEGLAKLQREEVAAEELRKAKNQILAGFYRQLKTIQDRANLLGSYEVFEGDFNKLFTADKAIEAVTAADVQRVAKLYFGANNRTVATLIPEKPEVKQ
jgi:zinc protease